MMDRMTTRRSGVTLTLAERQRAAEVERMHGGPGPAAAYAGCSRGAWDHAMVGGGMRAGTRLLILRAIGLDPAAKNYRPLPDDAPAQHEAMR